MLTYLLRRILIAVPTLLGVVLLVFLMVRLAPGDPAILLAGEFATPETLEAIRTRYGLDRPLPEQFALYLGALLQGDLGESARSRRPASRVMIWSGRGARRASRTFSSELSFM